MNSRKDLCPIIRFVDLRLNRHTSGNSPEIVTSNKQNCFELVLRKIQYRCGITVRVFEEIRKLVRLPDCFRQGIFFGCGDVMKHCLNAGFVSQRG